VRNQNFLLSYIDLLMNLSISFAAIFMLSVMLINRPVKAQHAVDERARLLIVMTWDPQSADDLDLWVKTPGGEKVGYTHPNGLVANLQRDDMGPINDYVELPNGTRQYRRFNQEITSIRSMAEGHYIVNVEFFRRHPDPENGRRSQGTVRCTVELIQVDPSYKQLEQRAITMAEAGDEETAFSFDITNGQVQDLGYAREGFVL
jgi:uncharacterized protein YfaP (DUF2135 family)